MENITAPDDYHSRRPFVNRVSIAGTGDENRRASEAVTTKDIIIGGTSPAITELPGYPAATTGSIVTDFLATYQPEAARTTTDTMMFSDTNILYWTSTANGTNETISAEKCEEMLEEFKEAYGLVFTYSKLVSICVTWSVFLLSMIGNLFVLSSVTVKRKRKHMSHSQMMMMHLTFANLAFTFFILPMDAIWRSTLEWYGGDFVCRIMNILKQFAMYISSAMIVVMGVDRVASLMCPMSLAMQRQRIKIMLGTAWGFSILNAIPAGVIFSIMHHVPNEVCPDSFITQCVDLNVQEKANLQPYYVYTMFVSFFGPLICILICYIFIAVSISRMARISKEAQKRCSLKNRGSHKSVTKRSLDRARRVSQVVTGLITAVFVICWGPYYVVGLIHWFDHNNNIGSEPPDPRLSDMAQVVMLTSMYLNPCLHPLITVLLMKEVRDNVVTQCRRGNNQQPRMAPRNPNPPKKIVVKDDKNGTKELLPKKNANGQGGSGSTRMHWV